MEIIFLKTVIKKKRRYFEEDNTTRKCEGVAWRLFATLRQGRRALQPSWSLHGLERPSWYHKISYEAGLEPPNLCNCRTHWDPALQWPFPSSFLLAVSKSSINSHIYAISALQPTLGRDDFRKFWRWKHSPISTHTFLGTLKGHLLSCSGQLKREGSRISNITLTCII